MIRLTLSMVVVMGVPLVQGWLTPAAWAGPFTIAVIPDTQWYADYQRQPSVEWPHRDGQGIFNRHIQWIADNAESRNIVFASHVGDLWDHQGQPEAIEIEIPIAADAMYRLHGVIPYGVVPGNHDYDAELHGPTGRAVDGLSLFDRHFGPGSRHFRDQPWYGGAFRQGNSYQKFTAGGREFLHLALELEPDDEVLAWAGSVIEANRSTPTILTTHQYLEWGGEWSYQGWRRDYGGNSPQEMWEKLISPNPEVFLVLCGHSFCDEALRIDQNDRGDDVWQVLTNYQFRENGGNGWLRLIEFDPELGQMHFRTYSTELDQWETDDNSDFVIPIDFNTRFAHVPEPASLVLLGTALLCLLGRGRKRTPDRRGVLHK